MLRGSVLVLLAGLACSSEGETWDDFDREERVEYMTTVVLPMMTDIFQERDPVAFEDFACETCHGTNIVEVDYAMPNALFPLPLDGTLEAASAFDADTTQFMLDEVFPTMATLLGREKYNSETNPEGFRCVGCHLVAP